MSLRQHQVHPHRYRKELQDLRKRLLRPFLCLPQIAKVCNNNCDDITLNRIININQDLDQGIKIIDLFTYIVEAREASDTLGTNLRTEKTRKKKPKRRSTGVVDAKLLDVSKLSE